jgi:hypothetical protein
MRIAGRVEQGANPSSPGTGIDEPLDRRTLDLGIEVLKHPRENLAYPRGADSGLSQEYLAKRKTPEGPTVWGRCLMEDIPHRHLASRNS